MGGGQPGLPTAASLLQKAFKYMYHTSSRSAKSISQVSSVDQVLQQKWEKLISISRGELKEIYVQILCYFSCSILSVRCLLPG